MNLIDVIKRAATLLLDNGAVIADMQSLGHRDLPLRRSTRINNQERVYSTKFVFYY